LSQLVSLDWTRGEARVAFYAAPDWIGGDRPAVLMIHGAHRSAPDLAAWPGLLKDAADVYLVEMPAHGRSTPIETPSVANVAQRLGEAIAETLPGREILVAGESVGGLVALALGGRSCAASVVAFDPPLSTRKLWAWRAGQLPGRREFMRGRPALAAFDRETFGIVENGLQDRLYYELFGDLTVPALIVAGDLSIFDPLDGHRPAAFNATDRFVIERLYPGKAEIRTIAGAGHLLLEEAEEACADILRQQIGRLREEER
jgi:pimeloyl-ACP methyl ester carboxylesterase